MRENVELHPLAKTQRFRGQEYQSFGTEKHEAKDGRILDLTVWWSSCPECGSRFSFTNSGHALPRFPNRRCQKCKKPGLKIKEVRVNKKDKPETLNNDMKESLEAIHAIKDNISNLEKRVLMTLGSHGRSRDAK